MWQAPAINLTEGNFSLWGSGEWWMLLAAQSMAIGTVMVRWVTKYSDPVMATGWVSCRLVTLCAKKLSLMHEGDENPQDDTFTD